MHQLIKRIFDFSIALFGLIILSPLFLIIAILIKLDSKGPVFFRQERVGKNRKIFKIWKFRTMVQEADEFKNLKKIRKWESEEGDPRTTKIGRLLRKNMIDELPQLINVLKGDVSLVGPRPFFLLRIKQKSEFWQKRFSVKPGITGLAQIRGGAKLSDQRTLKYDLEYIKKQSFCLDLKIILKTFGLLSNKIVNFQSRILLALIYLIFIAPIAIIIKYSSDFLDLKKPAKWIVKKQKLGSVKFLKEQY